MLNDLAVKRKALHLQIDQLRAARDTLATFVHSVRDSIDAVLDGINGSDEAARHAALEALRLRPPSREPTEEELLEGTPLREVPHTRSRALGRETLPKRPKSPRPRLAESAKSNGIETHVSRPCSRTTPRVPTSSTRSLRDCARRPSKSAGAR